MIATIEDFIPASELDQVYQVLARGRYQDGVLSAGSVAQQVKHNQELLPDSVDMQALNEIVMGSLVRHPEYRAICWPRRTAAPIYARYQKGMGYGAHVDDPVMGGADLYRSDISFTVFLAPRDSYQGGELVIVEAQGERRIKLDAGSVVFYPATSTHYVAPVTEGTRYVAVSWIQSAIRDAGKRELLYQFNQAREMLLQEQPNSEVSARLSGCFNNLVRRWVEV